ncbi:unnamed protein product [Parajaminaea phylloscopi]
MASGIKVTQKREDDWRSDGAKTKGDLRRTRHRHASAAWDRRGLDTMTPSMRRCKPCKLWRSTAKAALIGGKR